MKTKKKKTKPKTQPRSRKPAEFKQKVKGMSATGMSNRKIAKQTGITQGAVSRILNEPEAQKELEQSRLRFIAASNIAVDTLIKRMQEKQDVAIAAQILVANGILPRDLVPELMPMMPQNANQYNFMRNMYEAQNGENNGSGKEGQRGAPQEEKLTMVVDMLAQMSGTAKKHQIDLKPNGNGKNGHKVQDAELVGSRRK